MRQIEVLAPAGSFETMKAAYKAGADAVYMGGPMFGHGLMRTMQIWNRCFLPLIMPICMAESCI